MLDLDAVRAAWQLPPILTSWSPETGTVHSTVLFSTSNGQRYAWRVYRYTEEERERIVQEHALCAFVHAHGLPAITPLPLAAGATMLEHEGRFSALFPFAEGYQTLRGHLTQSEIAAMGRCLGELHHILRDYPAAPVQSRSFEVNQATTLAKLGEIEQAVTAHEQAEEHHWVLFLLAQRRNWLMKANEPNMQAFLALETQLIHGDYQETNLFFTNGRVSAIIDWDQAYTAPRAWEILRVLHYVGKLDVDFCCTFLATYRQILPLAQAELDIAAEVYSWMQAHSFWVYEELYLKGNTRVQVFLTPHEQFVPFAERWATLRTSLL
ncbi:MAG: phosphotransferase [Ktedonobacteraceae bacterium]